MRRLAGLLASIAGNIFGPVHSASYVYIVGPGADSAVADAHCSGDLSALDAAEAVCSADPGCTMLLAAACDDAAWMTCSSEPFVVYSAGFGTDACTMLKTEEVTGTSSMTSVSAIESVTTSTTTFTAGLYAEGPSVGSDGFMGHCHGEWSTRENAQAACDADASCFFMFSWDCQPWAWLPCGDRDDLSEMVAGSAAAEAEGAASCTEVLISLVTSSDTSTRTLTTRTATQTSSSMTTQTAMLSATEKITSTDTTTRASVSWMASWTSTTSQTIAYAKPPAAAAGRASLLELEPRLFYVAAAGLVLGCMMGTCLWAYMACPGLLTGVLGRAVSKKQRVLSRLQDPVAFPGEENPWVPPTTAMHPFEQTTPQTAELRLTVEDDPKVADDPLSVLDQEVLDRVINVAMKLRRI